MERTIHRAHKFLTLCLWFWKSQSETHRSLVSPSSCSLTFDPQHPAAADNNTCRRADTTEFVEIYIFKQVSITEKITNRVDATKIHLHKFCPHFALIKWTVQDQKDLTKSVEALELVKYEPAYGPLLPAWNILETRQVWSRYKNDEAADSCSALPRQKFLRRSRLGIVLRGQNISCITLCNRWKYDRH